MTWESRKTKLPGPLACGAGGGAMLSHAGRLRCSTPHATPCGQAPQNTLLDAQARAAVLLDPTKAASCAERGMRRGPMRHARRPHVAPSFNRHRTRGQHEVGWLQCLTVVVPTSDRRSAHGSPKRCLARLEHASGAGAYARAWCPAAPPSSCTLLRRVQVQQVREAPLGYHLLLRQHLMTALDIFRERCRCLPTTVSPSPDRMWRHQAIAYSK
jgi:hypothetical protein